MRRLFWLCREPSGRGMAGMSGLIKCSIDAISRSRIGLAFRISSTVGVIGPATMVLVQLKLSSRAT